MLSPPLQVVFSDVTDSSTGVLSLVHLGVGMFVLAITLP